MRIRVLSDLHLEHHDPPPGLDADPGAPAADVVVLAGDIGAGPQGLRWARRTFPTAPVLLVPGNHEAYDLHLHPTIAALRDAADECPPAPQPIDGTGTYFLHRDAVPGKKGVTPAAARRVAGPLCGCFPVHKNIPCGSSRPP